MHSAKVRWTPRLEGFQIGVDARFAGDTGDDASLELELRHGERLLAKDRYPPIPSSNSRPANCACCWRPASAAASPHSFHTPP